MSVTADTAYDTVAVYEAARVRGTTVVISPARTANVSGHGDGPPELVGSVSGYLANRTGGATLPGLLRAQDIAPFHNTLQSIGSLDEAREQDKSKPARIKLRRQWSMEPNHSLQPTC